MDTQVLADQQRLTYISSMLTRDTVQRTSQERWTIGKGGKSESGNSVPSTQLDDDDDDVHISKVVYV